MSLKRLVAGHTVPDFCADYPPALRVKLDELFVVETNDRFAAAMAGEVLDARQIAAMAGPVHVARVVPGDVLAIEVCAIKPRTGFAYLLASPSYGVLGERIERRVHRVAIDDKEVVLDGRCSLDLRPMIGKMGVAPAEGRIAGVECGAHGGALSNIELGPGATLLVRAQVQGGAIALEDVHARMGDGEATASAIELPAAVTLRCRVVDDVQLPLPMIMTPRAAITLGQGDSLDEAVDVALERMLSLIMSRNKVDLTQAAMWVGAAVDVRLAFLGARPRKAYAMAPRQLLGL